MNNTIEEKIDSLANLNKFIERYHTLFRPNCIILLRGDLGSGKTTFTKALAKQMGIRDNVTSPTFNIMNTYISESDKLYFFHADLYRVKSNDFLPELDFHSLANNIGFIAAIEWPEKCNIDFQSFATRIIEINIDYDFKNDLRTFIIKQPIDEKIHD